MTSRHWATIPTFVSWRWIFAINIPFVLATLALVRAGVPESRDEGAPQRIDYLGALLDVSDLGKGKRQ